MVCIPGSFEITKAVIRLPSPYLIEECSLIKCLLWQVSLRRDHHYRASTVDILSLSMTLSACHTKCYRVLCRFILVMVINECNSVHMMWISEKQSDVERIVIPVKLDASRSISSVNLQQKIVIQVSSDKPASQDSKWILRSFKAISISSVVCCNFKLMYYPLLQLFLRQE